MKILVACEEIQAVCKAFRRRGHEAYSCDIEPCSGGHPEWHLQVDAAELLKMQWDMIIAFPPCTYMTNAGAVRMRVNGEIVQERFEKAMEALDVVEEAAQHEHGQWIERDPYVNIFECSNCNYWFVLEDGSPAENNYNYCPNCGAKMEI